MSWCIDDQLATLPHNYIKRMNDQLANLSHNKLTTWRTYNRSPDTKISYTMTKKIDSDPNIPTSWNNLKTLYSKIQDMNLLEDNDVVFLRMKLTEQLDRQLMAHIINDHYRRKYEDLLTQHPEIKEWLTCMVYLLVNKPSTKECNVNELEDNYSAETKTMAHDGWKIESIKDCNNYRRLPDNLKIHLDHLSIFKNTPHLLHIGAVLSHMVPSCVAPLFMRVKPTKVTRLDAEEEEEQTLDGYTLNFTRMVLWRVDTITGDSKSFRIVASKEFLNALADATNATPYANKLMVHNLNNFADCFVLNSEDTRRAEYRDSDDVLLYGVFSKATCANIDTVGLDMEAYNETAFILENTSEYHTHLAKLMVENELRVEVDTLKLMEEDEEKFTTVYVNNQPITTLDDIPYADE